MSTDHLDPAPDPVTSDPASAETGPSGRDVAGPLPTEPGGSADDGAASGSGLGRSRRRRRGRRPHGAPESNGAPLSDSAPDSNRAPDLNGSPVSNGVAGAGPVERDRSTIATMTADGSGGADETGQPGATGGARATGGAPGPTPSDEPAEPAAPPPRLIMTPTQPVLGPVTTADELAEAVRRLRAGTGPIAVDAERASGYRYSQRAYLIQLARVGSGNILIDPIPFNDGPFSTDPSDPDAPTGAAAALSSLQDAIGDTEWVLHAASQDLPGLREIGLEPASVFDTETAGRLLGLERVSLASMLERFLDVTLEKGHSAADWSQRPLPADWLVYAALDVDQLVDLRDAVEAELIRTGKLEWAQQEWAATLAAPASGPRTDPWRRTSGIHAVRSRRQLAGVQALWEARDEIARARDIAPGRILPDAAIVAAVRANPESVDALTHLAVFRGPRQRQHAGRWFAALDAARARPDPELPPAAVGSRDGMPAPARWRERDPEAAVRLQAVRASVNATAEQHQVQAQNLLAADVIRRLCWTPPTPVDASTVTTALVHLGARPWQVALCAEPITAALLAPSADPGSVRPDATPVVVVGRDGSVVDEP